MRIAVLNYSGSVGKTVIAAHLLAPRMNGAPIFAVESTNESAADLGLDIDQLRGAQFGKLFRELLSLDDAIVDVGASNIEDFLDHMMKYHDGHEELDYFVLPVIPSGKAQRETLKTIQALSGIGVEADRIRVVFNRVEASVVDEFAAILGYQLASKSFQANPAAAVYDNDVFDKLAANRTTINEVLKDTTDYKALLRSGKDLSQKERDHYTDMRELIALAIPVAEKLDAAFDALFA